MGKAAGCGFAHKVGCLPKIMERSSPHDPISSTSFDFMGKAAGCYIKLSDSNNMPEFEKRRNRYARQIGTTRDCWNETSRAVAMPERVVEMAEKLMNLKVD
jgi:hypothetical protein